MHTITTLQTADFLPGSPLDRLVDNVSDLVSLPDAVTRLNALLADPDASNAEIAEVLTMDPALCARVLRAVNSAGFGLRRQVDSISKAIVIIGTSELHSLAVATSATQAFRRISTKLIDMESFWQHSVRAALAASGLAAAGKNSNRERIFLSALMHDVGKLVLYHHFPTKSTQILQAVTAGELQEDAEEAAFGFTHADVGALLLERWNLPASLAVPVRFHHCWEEAAQFAQEAALLHLADKVAHVMDGDSPVMPPSVLDVPPEAWEQAGCSPVEVDQVIAEVEMHWFEVMDIVAPSSTLLY